MQVLFTKVMQKTGLARPQPESDPGGEVTPLDLIFSCCVCNATFSEAYENDHEVIEMLSDGINPKDRLPTRLFLSSCCHVFCSKHIDGGGAPFHPAGRRPVARCPVCAKESELYAMRGFGDGEHDPAIPSRFFHTPPVNLDAKGNDFEALRFQYMSLLNYGTKVAAEKTRMRKDLARGQQELDHVRRCASEAQAKIATLQEENQGLREKNQELRAGADKFREQSPQVEQYLRVIPKLIEQNRVMQGRLAALGFQMHLEPLLTETPGEDAYRNLADLSRTASNHTGHRSADTLVNPDTMATSSPHTRPAKRQRVDSPLPDRNIHAPRDHQVASSRDRMPPPSRHLSRMKSMKKFWPTIRGKKGSRSHSSRTTASESPPAVDARTSETLRPAEGYRYQEDRNAHGHVPHQEDWSSDEHHMTGAIPVQNGRRSPEITQQAYASGFNGISTQFSFRSPVLSHAAISNAPVQKEPSYIHLMDPLTRNSALDLAIVDPRKRPSQCDKQNQSGQYLSDPRTTAFPHGQKSSAQWNLGHAFLPQPPNGTSLTSEKHPDPLRSNPTLTRGHQSYASQSADTASTHMQNTQNYSLFPNTPAFQRNQEFVTPAPQRFQQPAQAEESVVSPFFKSSNFGSQPRPKAGVNERDHSSLPHFDGYRYPGPSRMPPSGWYEARDLNGLSFIHSPLNERNEPIDAGHRAYGRRHDIGRNMTSRGCMQRPDRGRTPVVHHHHQKQQHHDAYAYNGSIERAPLPPPSRNAIGALKSNYMFPSSSQHSRYRATPLPTAQPSVVRPARVERPFSSRVNHPEFRHPSVVGGNGSAKVANISRMHVRRSAYAGSGRSLYSSAGRRAVRR